MTLPPGNVSRETLPDDAPKGRGLPKGARLPGERRTRRGGTPLDAEGEFAALLDAHKLLGYVTQHLFAPGRRWRFDFAWPDLRVAVEIEGGLRVTGPYGGNIGGHNSPEGYAANCEKYNAAAELGWFVFRYTVKQARTVAVFQIQRVLEARQEAQ